MRPAWAAQTITMWAAGDTVVAFWRFMSPCRPRSGEGRAAAAAQRLLRYFLTSMQAQSVTLKQVTARLHTMLDWKGPDGRVRTKRELQTTSIHRSMDFIQPPADKDLAWHSHGVPCKADSVVQ